MNRLYIVLILALIAVAGANADSLTNSVALFTLSGTNNTVRQYPLQTFSCSTTVASTTRVVVTAQTDRNYLEIAAGAGSLMTNEIWVGVGTTTVTVGTGRLVTKDNPLRLYVDDGVAFATIASEAVPMAVIQAKY